MSKSTIGIVVAAVVLILIGGYMYGQDSRMAGKQDGSMSEKEKMMLNEAADQEMKDTDSPVSPTEEPGMEKVMDGDMVKDEPAMKKEMAGDSMTEDPAMKKEMTDTVAPDSSEGVFGTSDAMKKEMDSMDGSKAMMNHGSYVPYTPSVVSNAKGDIVLFFRASWCPSCKALDQDIKNNLGSIPQSLTIVDVNYDTETELKKRYGVTYQHTLVEVDARGEQIAKWSGTGSLSDLVKKVQ